MTKTSPIMTASTASILYFVIFVILKYFLQNKTLDWQSAVSGALLFWIFIFLVHYLMNRSKQVA